METKVTNRMTLLLALTLTTACGTPNAKGDLTKADAQALIEDGDADDAICADAGFNDDDVCDDWCPDGDTADCAVSNVCEDGDTRDADDGCNTCSCMDGAWACTEMACNPDNNGNNVNRPLPLEIGDCSEMGDAKEVNSVTVDGDTMIVSASFSGGCAEHTVTACWDGAFLESFPVQARIKLIHDANGDNCEAYLTQEFTYDLTPMREAYVDGYQTDEGTILLGVEGQGAEYTF